MHDAIGRRHRVQGRNEGHRDLGVELHHARKLVEIVFRGVRIVLCAAEDADGLLAHRAGIAEARHDLLDRLDFVLRNLSVGPRHFGQATEEGHLEGLGRCLDPVGAFVELMAEANPHHRADGPEQ